MIYYGSRYIILFRTGLQPFLKLSRQIKVNRKTASQQTSETTVRIYSSPPPLQVTTHATLTINHADAGQKNNEFHCGKQK